MVDWNSMVRTTEPTPCLVVSIFDDEPVREALFYGTKEVEPAFLTRTNRYELYKMIPYILVRFPEEEFIQWLDGRYYKVVVYESEEAKINFLTQKGLKI